MDMQYRAAAALSLRRNPTVASAGSWTRRLRWAWARFTRNAEVKYRISSDKTRFTVKYDMPESWPNLDESFEVPCDLVDALADWLDTHIAEVPVEMKNVNGSCITLEKFILPRMRVVVREAAEIIRLRSLQPQFEAGQ